MSELDSEVAAIRTAYLALASLPPEAWERTLAWINERLASDERDGAKAALAVARFARKAGRLFKHERLAA